MTPSAPAARPRSILVVHPALPAHDEDSGSRRLRWILDLMVRQGHRVTMLGFAGKTQERYAGPLREMGIEVHLADARWWRENGYVANGPGLDPRGLLRRGRFDLVWISTYQMAEIYLKHIRHESPATRVVLDTVDVHHLRERRGAELAGDLAAMARADETRRREEAVYRAVDRIVAVSHDDAREANVLAPGVPVSVVSNVHELAPEGPGFDARSGAVFVGSFNHPPNADAVHAFADGAWPAVRQALPGATFTVVGTNPPASVQALDGRDGITVTGWVPETAPYLDAARISVAPLRYGAGVKGKIGEALSHGLPVVTTTVGAEGMGLVDGEHALIADDDAGLAAALVRLHGDRELWEGLAVRGREHVDGLLGVTAADRAIAEVIAATAVQPFVVTDPWTERGTLDAALGGYLGAFTAADPVSLVLPVPSDGPSFDEAAARVHAALDGIGADPEAIPDVSLQIAAADAVVPAAGVRVGAAPWPEAGTAVLDPAAPPAAWAAAEPGCDRRIAERPLASIIICCFGKRDYTERCLASLDAALGARLGEDVELVLVDNASPDDTRELLTAWADRARLVLLDENRNFSGGNNAGAAVATGRVLVFLNNDTEVAPGAIEALVEDALRPTIGLVGARLRYPDGRVQHGGYGWRATAHATIVPFHAFHYEDADVPVARASFETSGATGACIAVRAELFHDAGGFEDGFVNGWEDTDLVQRIRDTGARIWYRGDVDIVHHEGVTSGHDYARDDNEQRFRDRWNPALEPDDALLGRQLGARLGVLGQGPTGGTAGDGAPLAVVGPVLGFGPAGAEARALLRELRRQGLDVAARTPAPTWVRPALDPDEEALLDTAHDRDVRPGAAAIVLADASVPSGVTLGGPHVLRLASVPAARPDGAIAWAATEALADELRRAGWPADAVAHVPPLGIAAAAGPGGDGVLALLPDHDPAARDALLDALVTVDQPISILPVARTPELARALASRLPGATLLDPTADERALAALAARADVVVAADPDDPFDRRALIAAGAGAAVVARPGGPAAATPGGAAALADPYDGGALAGALRDAVAAAAPEQRQERAAAVARAGAPERLAAALRSLAGAPPVAESAPAPAAPSAAAAPAPAATRVTPRPDLGDFAWALRLHEERRAAGAPRISGVVNTRDEERNLDDALRSLAWVDELVVCDMHSADGTREIAERHGARVLLHEPAGIVEPARQHAIDAATGAWVVVLDADERISEQLARELDALSRADAADAVDVPYRNWLCGRWMEATGWGGPDWHLRFFKKGAVRWGDRVHTTPDVHGRRLRLDPTGANAILHFNCDDLDGFVEKVNRYTAKEADAVEAAPTRPWADVARVAREELLTRWAPGVDGGQSAALSLAMLFYRLLEGVKQWERHGFPDVELPATGAEALRDLAGDGRLAHRAGIAAFEQGDVQVARDHLEQAARAGFDPEVVSDLAVACHAVGDLERARDLLRACLVLAPDHAAAQENLIAVEAALSAARAAA